MEKVSRFVLVSSPYMHELGDQLCAQLKTLDLVIPHYKIEFLEFANGEMLPCIPHTIRGQHVFFLHALQQPDPNAAVLMMLIVNDALKRASASGITMVTPYMSYMRQDRKDQPRVPISARMIADLIESNHIVKSLITMDLHAEQEQGFFSIPVDDLIGAKIFAEYLKKIRGDDFENVVMLAPDFGGSVRNHRMARMLGDLPICIMKKRRNGPNEAEIMNVIGNVSGKTVVIYEDMIDTGGTAIKVIKRAKELGAREVYLCGTHGIFSRNAEKYFREAEVRVATTDSIPRTAEYYAEHSWLTKVSIVPYLAEAMYQATLIGGSISNL